LGLASRVWVWVIPLKGRRGNVSDSGEAQGLRIVYIFMKIQ